MISNNNVADYTICTVPRFVMPVQSIKSSFKQLLKTKGMLVLLQEGAEKAAFSVKCKRAVYSDIVSFENCRKTSPWWLEEFLTNEVIPVFLLLNVDWFQPFERTSHSSGAILLAIANLPREIRYLCENIFVWGITPGPLEPKRMENILKLLVDELLDLVNEGYEECVIIKDGMMRKIKFKFFLIGCLCDMPAQRKVT